jgi:chorismate mutase/prephenate dehydratase
MANADPSPAHEAPLKLEELRVEIDALDDALLALFERRMEVAIKVARLKGDDGLLKLRPKRESAIVARLAGKASIATPELIAHVWRELMAHSRHSQAEMTVHLYAPNAAVALREAARERFGRVTPIVAAGSPGEALAAAAAGEVVALIELDGAALELPEGVRLFGAIETADGRAVLAGRMAEADIPDDELTGIAAAFGMGK